MEQAPQQGKLFHFRLVILFSLLFLSDLAHIAYAWKVALVHSSWILFGFEVPFPLLFPCLTTRRLVRNLGSFFTWRTGTLYPKLY